MRGVTIACLALLLASPASVEAQRRLTIRAPTVGFSLACTPALGGHTFSFSVDSVAGVEAWYREARASLQDPANFSATGTVPVTFEFGPPFDSFEPQGLDGADILVLNPFSPRPQDFDLSVFGVYARGGVGFVSFQNAAATFFARSAEMCVGDNTATFASATGVPGLMGPFGTVTSPYGTGYNCMFSMLDPLAFVISSNDAGPNAVGIDLAPRWAGAGRAISFGDEEHIGSLSVPGCGARFLVRGNNNDVLLRNVFAWISETASDPIPSSVEGTGDTDGDGTTDDLDGDTDGDGTLDVFEAGDADPDTAPVDTDGDGLPDYRDDDSDGDGIADENEGSPEILVEPGDTDMDGTLDFRDDDSDGDGVADSVEGRGDADLDGTPDFRETDSDGDGVPDGTDVCRRVPDPDQTDTDMDGVGDACETPDDAGPRIDSGTAVDGGPIAVDAGPRPADAGRAFDAGGGARDAGGGGGGTAEEAGCGCHAGSRGGAGSAVLVGAAIAVAVARRRRRRR